MNVHRHVGAHPHWRRNRCSLSGGAIVSAVILAIVLLPLWLPARLFADTNFSPTVSYSYPDGLPPSPTVSYQYYEWPGNDVLGLFSSLTASYYWQFSTGSSAFVVVYGRVTNKDGLGIAGATVSAAVALRPVAQTTSDSSGNYTLPTLDTGTYVLNVTASGYASAARALTLGGSASVQDFQLNALPAPPALQQTTRQPPATFTQPPVGPMGSTLGMFDGANFTNITANNAPDTNLMTIVLTHGWTSDPTMWTNMVAQMRAEGLTTNIANIVVWDWHTAASGAIPEERTPSQGVALGQALVTSLGANYVRPIHFIGHSLGALVNAAAANYLQGDRTAQQATNPTPWSPTRTHMTLLDAAEDATALEGLGVPVLWDGISVMVGQGSTDLSVGFGNDMLGWKPALPVHRAWADNYTSLCGLYQPHAVNVELDQAHWLSGAVAQHGYPCQWYGMTVTNPAACTLGFQRSYEALKLGVTAFDFPPSTTDFPPGVAYVQPEAGDDPFHLNLAGIGTQLLGMGKRVVLVAPASTVQTIGNVTAEVEDGAQAGWQWTVNGFNYAANAAEQGGQAVVNAWDSAVMGLTLTVGSLHFNSQLQAHTLSTLNVSASDSTSNSAPMAWVPVQIPTNAAFMAFDFIITGDPSNDVMVCGIGTSNVFSLEAQYIPTNNVSSSRLIDVSVWAGTTNELFFGLVGGTSTNASLQIDNIRFYNLQSQGSSSNSVDSVGDGIPDSWRAQYFPDVDPTGTTTNNLSCATCDADGTGQNNLFKYLAGLDPTNSASMFQILSVERASNDLNVTWQTVGGKTNVLQAAFDLSGSYSNVSPNIIISGSGDTTTNYLDTGGATNTPSRFYRVRLVP